MRGLVALLAACGSAPAPERPATPVASVDAASIDTPPDASIADQLASAPAWVFRYNAPGRLETWTLRHGGELAMISVESAQGTIRYTGSAADGDSLKLAVATTTAKLALECKRAKFAAGAQCNSKPTDKTTKQLDVLDCFHPDFKSPMKFAAAPGLEFITDDKCSGYRTIAP